MSVFERASSIFTASGADDTINFVGDVNFSSPGTATFNDGLTVFNTLSMSGYLVDSATFAALDGSVSSPGFKFTNDIDTGFWRANSGDVACAGDGVELWYAYSAGLVVGGRVTGSAFLQSGGGSESAPVYTMWNENNTGFYRHGTDDWGWSANSKLSILMIGGSAVDERLRLQHNNSNESCYISFFGNGGAAASRSGYVGYPGTDDLWIKNEDTGGHLYIDTQATVYVRQNAVTKGAWDATGVYFQEAYDYTATASNCDVSNTGRLSRDTSSLRYKTDVEPLDLGLAKRALRDLDFIWYRFGEEQGNDRRHGRFGSTAESAHEKGYPWLTTYEYDRDCGCQPLGKWVKRREWVEEQKIPVPKEEQAERGRWEIIEPHWREVDYWDENFRIEHTCGTERPIGFDYRGFTAVVAAVTEEQEEHLERHDDELADLKRQVEVLTQRLNAVGG